jgi:D-alanyl-D-alanine dipeptidase
MSIELEDLFHGRNPQGISNSDQEFVARVEQMINSLPERFRGQVTVISGYRSYEEQEALYDAYKNGHGNLAAPPGRSNHNHGLAMDLTFASDQVRKWVHANAARFGLAFPIASEAWHIEPAGLRDGTYTPGSVDYSPDDEMYQQLGEPPVDNTDMEVQLKRVADKMMGGKFDVLRNMRVADASKLAEKNIEGPDYV